MPATALWGAAGELAASRHGALTRSQAVSAGLSPDTIERMLRDRTLTEPIPGVLVVCATPKTWRQDLAVCSLSSRNAGVACTRAAAALHGMDRYADGPLEVMMPSSRRPRFPDLVLHTGPLQADDIVVVDGIRVTSIARTLADLGSVDPIEKVRYAFEWAWRKDHSLTWMQQVVDRLHRPGQHGTKMLQELLVEAREKAQPTGSALELRLEAILADLPGLVRQHEIRNADDVLLGRVDFAIPHRQIAIEAHSREWHFGLDARQRDHLRDKRIIDVGWTTRYITSEQMRDPSKVRRAIIQLIGPNPPTLPSNLSSAW